MEAWMAFLSIMAIVAIVIVAGGLIAFIAHMIIGAFDNKPTTKESKDVIDYTQYKQLSSGNQGTQNNEYDFVPPNHGGRTCLNRFLSLQSSDCFNLLVPRKRVLPSGEGLTCAFAHAKANRTHGLSNIVIVTSARGRPCLDRFFNLQNQYSEVRSL